MIELNKTDVLWFSQNDWIENLYHSDYRYGDSFKKVISFEEDYPKISHEAAEKIISNIKNYLYKLAEKAANNESNLPWFEKYYIESIKTEVFYKKVGIESEIPTLDGLVKSIGENLVQNKDISYFQIENATVEIIGNVSSKIAKRNLDINTLSAETINQLLKNKLIMITNNGYQPTLKIKILFGRDIFF